MKILCYKSIWLSVFVSVFSLLTATAAGDAWMTDYSAAQKRAKAEGKPLLLDFTGSDWCPPCMALNSQVFSQEAFLSYAGEALILVEVDFPRRKSQSAELKAQNEALAVKYGIEYFPTILLVSPEGEVLGRTGYQSGGASAYVAHLKSFLE